MSANNCSEHWIIESVKTDGNRFRPSDWIERISATLARFGADHRLCYDTEVQPCMIEGQKCLLVGKGLAERKPELLAYILKFARDNQLRIQEDRRSMALPTALERRTR